MEIFLTSVDDYVTEDFVEPSVSVELCLATEERYVGDMEYESHEERCANHGLPYNIEYESHEERCANDVEYESKQKAEKESGVKLSLEETISHLASIIEKGESVDIASMYVWG